MKRLLTALILLLAVPALSTIRLKIADNQAPNYPTVKTLEYLAKQLKKETQGEIKLKVFHSGQLGQEKDVIELLKTGAISMARVNTGNLNGIVPETKVINLPFMFRDRDHMYKVLTGDVGRKILDSFESHGFIGLAFLDAGSRSVYNSKRPVKIPADLKGMKIRVMKTDIAISLVEALGASATPMNFGEVYGALQTRVIDGAENNEPSFYNEKHFEVAKYYSRTEHLMFPEVIIISKKAWGKLNLDQKKTLRRLAEESTQFMKKEWAAFEKASMDKVIKAGVQVNEVDKNKFIAQAQKIYPKFVKDKKLQALISDIQKVK